MTIPKEVIQKVDAALGMAGRPHHILVQGEWVDTGCFEWSEKNLEDAMIRAQKEALSDPVPGGTGSSLQERRGPRTRTRESSPEELARRQREFAAQMSDLFGWPPPMPELSQDLDNALQRIQESVDDERFFDGHEFDMEGYVEEVRELILQESPHIQAELADLASQLMDRLSPPSRTAQKRKDTLEKVRAQLFNDPVIAYEGGFEMFECIVVAPTENQFDILVGYERTQGANWGLQTEDIIDRLRVLDEKYGIDTVGATGGSVEFILKHVPKGKEARELGGWLLDFCPDLHEAPASFPDGRVVLWWD